MARTVEEMNNAYELLACAICKQAVQDYQKALRDIDKYGDKVGKKHIVDKAKWTIADCERFFRSEWYHELMPNLDGEKLIQMIKKQYEDSKKKKNTKKGKNTLEEST